MSLFWEKGYVAASLDDLLTAIGISRSSFYAAFGSKEAVFGEALRLYRQRMMDDLRDRLRRSPSGMAFIGEVLEIPALEAEGRLPARGCLAMNSASELGNRHPSLDPAIQSSLAGFEGLFRKAVDRAKSEGDVGQNTDSAALATLISASLGGLRTLAKAGVPPKKIRAAAKTILKALRG